MEITTDLSSIKIWDDLLDNRFILDLDEESNTYPWTLTNIANRRSFPNNTKGTHLFWGTGFKPSKAPRKIIELYSFFHKNFSLNDLNLHDIQLNGQSIGQDGTTHVDIYNPDKIDYTLMVFLNYEWKKKWGGEFQFLNNLDPKSKILKTIYPKPGRVVFFKGNIPHRGLGPRKKSIVRKTLVYRLVKHE